MENLPIEIQWNIIKFTRHPVADAFLNAEGEYREEICYMEYHLNGKEYDAPTFTKYLRIQMRTRHSHHRFARLYPDLEDSYDDESDDESDDDYCPEVEHTNRDYSE